MAAKIYLAVLFAAVLVAGVGGQTKDCTYAYNYLTGCLSYVSGTDATPSLVCCSGISILNSNDADCLCQIVKQYSNGTTPGVNVTRTYALPALCGVAVDTAKCPGLALPPGASNAPAPPGALGPPTGGDTGSSIAPGRSSASANRASGVTGWMVVLAATLGATHALTGMDSGWSLWI